MELDETPQTPEEVFTDAGLLEFEPTWQDNILRNLGTYAAIGSAVLATTLGVWHHIEISGKWKLLKAEVEQPAPIINTETIVDWNMHGQVRTRIKQIRRLAVENNAGVVALQEVSTDDANTLHKHFPSWNTVYVLADTGQHLLEAGYGNVIMTRQNPTDIKARSFPGTTLLQSIVRTGFGAMEDTANLFTSTADAAVQKVADGNNTTIDDSFQATKDGRQEKRAAVAVTNKVEDAGNLNDIRIIDGHISGNPSVSNRQLRDFVSFIKSNTQPDRPTVVCADFNRSEEVVKNALTKINFTVAPKTGKFANVNDDFCAYSNSAGIEAGKVSVLSSPVTDHYPLVATIVLPASQPDNSDKRVLVAGHHL